MHGVCLHIFENISCSQNYHCAFTNGLPKKSYKQYVINTLRAGVRYICTSISA